MAHSQKQFTQLKLLKQCFQIFTTVFNHILLVILWLQASGGIKVGTAHVDIFMHIKLVVCQLVKDLKIFY